jgi:DeoR/GlpR family transcriptional regulator of sugar metabolism
MALNHRRTNILELIKKNGFAKVQTLSKTFEVTEVTIRQDLEFLEKEGYVHREHGGAYIDKDNMTKSQLNLLNEANLEKKKEIAQKAVCFIQEGDSIILDSGSTTTELAKLLKNFRQLTVITNSLSVAMILVDNPNIDLIMTGGELKVQTMSLTGELAAESFKNIHVNKLFLATAGISSTLKLTYPTLSDLVVKSAMIKSADAIYLLADSSKLGSSAFANLGPASLIQTLITDSDISGEFALELKNAGIQIV